MTGYLSILTGRAGPAHRPAMPRWVEQVGIAIGALIPLGALLALFEIHTSPESYRWDDYAIGGYAALCFAIINYRIIRDWLNRP